VRRQLDLAHQRADVLPLIHPLDGRVVHVLNGVAIASQLLPDFLAATDRTVAGQHELRLEREHAIDLRDVLERQRGRVPRSVYMFGNDR